jgi:NadR type nicotinamide-nucleotide adenylyltransferase
MVVDGLAVILGFLFLLEEGRALVLVGQVGALPAVKGYDIVHEYKTTYGQHCWKNMQKKIALTGPESSGKSTLARQLATYFDAPVVPEYARLFLSLLGRPYVESDLMRIAAGQLRWEEALSDMGSPLLICDTELTVIKVWSEHRYGRCAPELSAAWGRQGYDLMLLCRPDIPWAYDPLREHPEGREVLFARYEAALAASGRPYEVLEGNAEARLRQAVDAIKKAIRT